MNEPHHEHQREALEAAFLKRVQVWLEKPLNVGAVDAEIRGDPAVVERFRIKWNEFKSQIKDGDELWSFNSPKAAWNQLAGRAGYAIIRGGEVVAAICTLVS